MAPSNDHDVSLHFIGNINQPISKKTCNEALLRAIQQDGKPSMPVLRKASSVEPPKDFKNKLTEKMQRKQSKKKKSDKSL